MCVRNLSERVLFSERGKLLRSINLGIKIDKNVKEAYFSQKKTGIKWCKKGCLSLYITQKGASFFNFGTTKSWCFFKVNQSNGTQLDGILRSGNFDDATSGL